MAQELKVYDLVDVQDYRGKVYLKSEADKAITELKDRLREQTSIAEEAFKLKDVYRMSYTEAVAVSYKKNKEIRHHKYKRCLAMARWCASRSASWCLDPADEQLHKSDFYDKWKLRWLELAEKFKEAK